MMLETITRAGLLATSLVAVAMGAHVARLSFSPPPLRASPAPTGQVTVPRAAPVDSMSRAAIEAAPFRLRRVLPSVRYDPLKAAEPGVPAVPKPPKPTLVLSGIVWGFAPAAALEGIPGVDGARLVMQGDTVAGLRIRRISRGEVVVAGFDTTWVLVIKESW